MHGDSWSCMGAWEFMELHAAWEHEDSGSRMGAASVHI